MINNIGKTAKFDVTKTLKPTEVGEDLEVTKKSNGDDGKIWAESLRRADDKYAIFFFTYYYPS